MTQRFGRIFLKGLQTAYLVSAVFLIIGVIGINSRLYYPSETEYTGHHLNSDILPQIKHIKAALKNDSARQMQRFFPEGYFFSYVLYGLAWVEIGLRQQKAGELSNTAMAEARWAHSFLETPSASSQFPIGLDPPRGVFYLAWKTWLLGGIVKLHQIADIRDGKTESTFIDNCNIISNAFNKSEIPFLCSYQNMAWPCDNVVAMAALNLHDSIFAPRFQNQISAWVSQAKTHVDPETGLLPHQVDPATGKPITVARGSSQSIIARFLIDVDPEWGYQQYQLFRNQFAATVFGLPGIREYPKGFKGVGDIDSGPLVFGISVSSTVVTMGAARNYGDDRLLHPLMKTSEMAGLPISCAGKKMYAFGLLPVGDEFVLWSKTAMPWTFHPEAHPGINSDELPEIVHSLWRLPVHVASLIGIIIVCFPFLRFCLKTG